MIGSLPQGSVSPDEVGAALSRVMASEPFANSKRLRRFLAYIVDRTLAGETESLKEYGIALAVFDREASFDPRVDSIVRVEARRLRQQLESYYRSAGARDPLVIDLPKGSYVPVFERHHGSTLQAETDLPVLPLAVESPPRPAGWLRTLLTFSAAGAILLALSVWTWRRTHPPIPHGWRLEGTRLAILDARDRPCWQKSFPAFKSDYADYVRDKVLISDIDRDGRPEVLVSLHPVSDGERGDSLICYDFRGRIRWEHHYGARKSFGTRSFDASYTGRFFRLVESRGKRYILTVANHHIWYPAQAALLDPATGRPMEEYWHPGSIYHLAFEDLDGDGRQEILLGAINNPGEGLGHPGLAVLKIPFSDTPPKPAAEDSAFPAATGGGELAYLLFPQPDLNRVMGTLPIPNRTIVDQNHRILMHTPLPETGGVLYYLDFKLNVQECRVSDNFAALHERYRLQHLLDHRFAPDEGAALCKVARFAAAPDANSSAVNRLWP